MIGWEIDFSTERSKYSAKRQSKNFRIGPNRLCHSPTLKPIALRELERRRAHICAYTADKMPTFNVGAGTGLTCATSNGEQLLVGVVSYGGYWERVGGGGSKLKVFN